MKDIYSTEKHSHVLDSKQTNQEHNTKQVNDRIIQTGQEWTHVCCY